MDVPRSVLLFAPLASAAAAALSAVAVPELLSLISVTSNNPIVYQARKLLQQYKRQSTCNGLAVAMLVKSCRATRIDNVAYDEPGLVKRTFAARIALCEISGPGVSIPLTCSVIFVDPKDSVGLTSSWYSSFKKPSTTPGANILAINKFRHIDADELGPLTTAVEQRSQWWISYSNARQSAVSMC